MSTKQYYTKLSDEKLLEKFLEMKNLYSEQLRITNIVKESISSYQLLEKRTKEEEEELKKLQIVLPKDIKALKTYEDDERITKELLEERGIYVNTKKIIDPNPITRHQTKTILPETLNTKHKTVLTNPITRHQAKTVLPETLITEHKTVLTNPISRHQAEKVFPQQKYAVKKINLNQLRSLYLRHINENLTTSLSPKELKQAISIINASTKTEKMKKIYNYYKSMADKRAPSTQAMTAEMIENIAQVDPREEDAIKLQRFVREHQQKQKQKKLQHHHLS